MEAFLESITAFPTVIFTVLLIVVFVYWGFVVFGAIDIDFLGGEGLADGAAEGIAEGAAEGIAEGAAEGIAEGAAEGIAEGAAEGIAEGAAEGIAEGVAEGAAEGVAEGAAEGGAEGATEGSSEGVLGFVFGLLKLRSAPVTVVISALSLFGWIFSYIAMRSFGPLPWFGGLGVFLLVFVIALVLTSIVIRPLAPIFASKSAAEQVDLIGKTCTIRTGRVDEKFGQARFEGGGASLLIDVRCEAGNRLKRGKEALIIDHDRDKGFYWVEDLDPLLRLDGKG